MQSVNVKTKKTFSPFNLKNTHVTIPRLRLHTRIHTHTYTQPWCLYGTETPQTAVSSQHTHKDCRDPYFFSNVIFVYLSIRVETA